MTLTDDNLSGSHLQIQVNSESSVDGINVSGCWPDWSTKSRCHWSKNDEVVETSVNVTSNSPSQE